MAGSTSLPALSQAAPASPQSIRFLLRVEGLAVAVVSLALYARFGGSWWLFAALWLAPDLSMLSYLHNPAWGSRVYNAVHSYATPATLGLVAFLLHAHLSLALALIWTNHIGVDRLLGYGLKYSESFGLTHLGRVGRRSTR